MKEWREGWKDRWSVDGGMMDGDRWQDGWGDGGMEGWGWMKGWKDGGWMEG